MDPTGTQKISESHSCNKESRSVRKRYEELIKVVADAKLKSKGTTGDGDAPDEPSYELGKIR